MIKVTWKSGEENVFHGNGMRVVGDYIEIYEGALDSCCPIAILAGVMVQKVMYIFDVEEEE